MFSNISDENKIKWGSCGLSGETKVNVTFADGQSCDAILTDWNSRMCSSRSKLMIATDMSCWQKESYGTVASVVICMCCFVLYAGKEVSLLVKTNATIA